MARTELVMDETHTRIASRWSYHPSCNRSKSATLAARTHLERWLERLELRHDAIAEIGQGTGLVVDSQVSCQIAAWGYARYAVEATYATTNLATFKAIVKKYPGKPRETILRDLVAGQPGQEGKWFAAAKDAGLFELAIELANRSPSDPRTLISAARDFAVERPQFALATGMTALRGIAGGWGYDITGVDVLDAYAAIMAAAGAAGVDETVVNADVRAIIAASHGGGEFVGRVLEHQLRK